MDIPVTLLLSAVFLILTILFGWIGARPARPLARPRLIPWRLLMLAAFVMMIAVLVHAVAILRAANGFSPS
jgi:hypothetical protein